MYTTYASTSTLVNGQKSGTNPDLKSLLVKLADDAQGTQPLSIQDKIDNGNQILAALYPLPARQFPVRGEIWEASSLYKIEGIKNDGKNGWLVVSSDYRLPTDNNVTVVPWDFRRTDAIFTIDGNLLKTKLRDANPGEMEFADGWMKEWFWHDSSRFNSLGAFPRRGEIWDVVMDPVGRHMKPYQRPCVVVSSDRWNADSLNQPVVVPLTSKKRGGLPFHVVLNSGVDECAKPHKITSVSNSRVKNYLGTVGERDMKKIQEKLGIFLGLGHIPFFNA